MGKGIPNAERGKGEAEETVSTGRLAAITPAAEASVLGRCRAINSIISCT
jgi:hypothetical protein